MDDKRDDGIVNSCYIIRKLPARSGFPTARHRKFFGAFLFQLLHMSKNCCIFAADFKNTLSL